MTESNSEIESVIRNGVGEWVEDNRFRFVVPPDSDKSKEDVVDEIVGEIL